MQVEEYNTTLTEGVSTYVGIAPKQVKLVSVYAGCIAPAPPANGRRLLVNNNTTNVTYVSVNGSFANSTAKLQLSDVPSSVTAAKVTDLYNPATASARLADLTAAIASALAAAGAPALAAPLSASGPPAQAVNPAPALAPPPLPPGWTPADLRREENDKIRNSLKAKLQTAGTAVAYALLGVIVLWMPAHALIHAVTAAHARRTTVSVALALHCERRAPRASQLGSSPDKGDDAGDDDEALAGKRFAARNLAAALASALQREASAAGAADLQPAPRQVELRPLLRSPLVAALGAKETASASQRLAARLKPSGLAWRFKRWLVSELHWQAREMRHAVRALRRCGGGSRDPVGKAVRSLRCCLPLVYSSAPSVSLPAVPSCQCRRVLRCGGGGHLQLRLVRPQQRRLLAPPPAVRGAADVA